MNIDAEVDEDQTEFHPGHTQYTVCVDVPNQGMQQVVLKREVVHGTFSSDNKVHPILLKVAIDCIKNYIAKIYTQSSY